MSKVLRTIPLPVPYLTAVVASIFGSSLGFIDATGRRNRRTALLAFYLLLLLLRFLKTRRR